MGDVHCAKGKEGLQSRAEQFACLEMSVEKMPVLPECSLCVSVGWAKKMNPQIVIWLSATPDIQAGLNSGMLWVQSHGYQQQGEVCTPWDRAAVSKWPTVCCTSENPSL